MATTRRKTRLKDIARAGKVSIATASMALADHPAVSAQTKERIVELSRRMGYRRAGMRDAQRTRRFGVMIVGTDLHHAINEPLFYHLSSVGLEQNVRFEYASCDAASSGELIEQTLKFSQGLDGLIICGPAPTDLLGRLRRDNIAHVMVGHALVDDVEYSRPPVTIVAPDLMQMGYAATMRLLRCGHQRVAFVAEIIRPGMSHDLWLRGYKLAHVDTGQPIDHDLVQITGQLEVGAASAVEQLLALEQPPTAYSVPDTRLAASVLAELRLRGRDLPQQAIIFNAVPNAARAFAMGDYPHMESCFDQLAEQAITQLQRLCDHRDARPLLVLVPFEAKNLPEPTDG